MNNELEVLNVERTGDGITQNDNGETTHDPLFDSTSRTSRQSIPEKHTITFEIDNSNEVRREKGHRNTLKRSREDDGADTTSDTLGVVDQEGTPRRTKRRSTENINPAVQHLSDLRKFCNEIDRHINLSNFTRKKQPQSTPGTEQTTFGDDWIEFMRKCSRFGKSNLLKGQISIVVSDIILWVMLNIRDGEIILRNERTKLIDQIICDSRDLNKDTEYLNEDRNVDRNVILRNMRRGRRFFKFVVKFGWIILLWPELFLIHTGRFRAQWIEEFWMELKDDEYERLHGILKDRISNEDAKVIISQHVGDVCCDDAMATKLINIIHSIDENILDIL